MAMSGAPEGLSACQLDAYLRRLETRAVRCEVTKGGFLVELDATILYAEGGGQPADHGAIAEATVGDVQRAADGRVLHLTDGPVELGPVEVEVDWARRYDHMQQHTAQHLLTALAMDRFGYQTLAFHLGAELSTIDLDGQPSADELGCLGEAIEAEVVADRRVSFEILSPEAYALAQVRSRGLPADHSGPVRVVRIEGLDVNTCGGTHVAQTGELRLVELVRCERHKGGARLSFRAGARAVAALFSASARERALSEVFQSPAAEHLACAERLRRQLKDAGRAQKSLLSELCVLLGEGLGGAGEAAVALHRPAGDLASLQAIASAAQRAHPELCLLLTAGSGRDGVFLICGPPQLVATVAPAIAARLGGRGGGARGRYQGKASDLEQRGAAFLLLRRAAGG
jgi:misacylated tRNA(Ala) deacylase